MENVPAKTESRELAFGLGEPASGVCEVGDSIEKSHPGIRNGPDLALRPIQSGSNFRRPSWKPSSTVPMKYTKPITGALNDRLDEITFVWRKRFRGWAATLSLIIRRPKVLTRHPMIGHLNHGNRS